MNPFNPFDLARWTAETQVIYWGDRLCSDEYIAEQWNEKTPEERLRFIEEHKHQIRGTILPDKKD